MLVLKEKIQILESQLKIKEHQPLLEKSQLEESVKRTQSILDLTREQFDQSLTISRKEADIQSTKLDEKKTRDRIASQRGVWFKRTVR